ncbi:MAG TPA: glycosyl hydrolase, partial [Gemmatimonadaceae bacterium]|nr:glycosyl hydrolase [Gemmatimonadaceae bacterium]
MLSLRRVGPALLPISMLLLAGLAPRAAAQQFDSTLYAELHWRMIGPFRGGRTVAASGVPGEPNVFYVGVNDGGVWKTDDYGRVWTPIFDDQPTGSIGALAVAPSDPNIIYVGSGEGLQRPDLSTGDGIYKSTDAGKSWTHLGLRDGQQIGHIIIDPHDANRLFVAVLGHPYGPSAERGVYRSTDGGRTFHKVLYKDENTGAIDLAFDPTNAQTIYAVLWAARQGPWEYGNAYSGPGSGLFKSTDGGTTWHQLTQGLPTPAQGLSRMGIGIAPSDPNRIYAEVNAGRHTGVYRSDDAGESWTRVNSANRVSGRGDDFAEVKVDPANPDIVYVANTSLYRSTDGGHHFTAFKGAPGGDDYHRIWINPRNPHVILLGVDQGATLTVDGGHTWSSWYNQPTAQMFHVTTDNRFPYRIYGGQQESGSVGILSRGNDGAITFRDWHPVGVEEYGYAAPDPLHPGIIYGGKVSRYDETTGQVQQVGPDVLRSGKYRFDRTAPIIFSPADPHILYFAAQVLFETKNGGHSWRVISPDLTRAHPGVPSSLGVYSDDAQKTEHRGVIYSIGPSPRDAHVIWVGTDDGLIQMTRDGGAHWSNVTPPAMTPWSKVTQLDASHFDAATVYASVSRLRVDDMHPYIYRTHDGGKTWTLIVTGIPDDEPVNVVREDPVRRGLLFAGTERATYVSLDDGAHWQSLRLNMPATSIRDLAIHANDLVAGTHGRSIWILDDLTPLRQLTARVTASDAYLFRPAPAYRVRRNTNTDTPLPPEEPAGQNPPDGAIIDYYLKSAPSTPVVLEILDHAGTVVRRYSSTDTLTPTNPDSINVPMYWVRPPRNLSAQPGMHRFVWNLYYTPATDRQGGYPISAIVHDTPR